MISLRLRPWRKFSALRDRRADRRFLAEVAEESEKAFRRGIRSRKSGRRYLKPGGRVHTASAPGEYPARDSGRLASSIDTRVSRDRAEIGTSVPYAIFLRNGTRKMARRRMSDDALQEGTEAARGKLFNWIRWKRG